MVEACKKEEGASRCWQSPVVGAGRGWVGGWVCRVGWVERSGWTASARIADASYFQMGRPLSQHPHDVDERFPPQNEASVCLPRGCLLLACPWHDMPQKERAAQSLWGHHADVDYSQRHRLKPQPDEAPASPLRRSRGSCASCLTSQQRLLPPPALAHAASLLLLLFLLPRHVLVVPGAPAPVVAAVGAAPADVQETRQHDDAC